MHYLVCNVVETKWIFMVIKRVLVIGAGQIGITPGFGGTQLLSRLIGMGIAKELIYTGDIIDAT